MTYAIAQIVGDDAWTIDRLKDQRIHTSSRLLEQAKRPKGRKDISEKIGLSESKVLDLANTADVMRVKGIGREYVALLRLAGVYTMRDLRSRNPRNLYLAMVRVNALQRIVDFLPSKSFVKSWVAQAKCLRLVISYK